MDRAALMALLRQREYVSGEWVSQNLGVTRMAVFKAVQALRAVSEAQWIGLCFVATQR